MHEERITVHSEGSRIRGVIRTKQGIGHSQPLPVIINPPGTLGLATGPTLDPYHRLFTEAGFAVVAVNYRGYGESEGERGWIDADREVEDQRNVVTYVTTRPDLDAENIFCFGQGGTGAGNAIILTAIDDRIRAVAAQAIFADGSDWLRASYCESEWQAYRRRVADNEKRIVLGEQGEMVNPREEIGRSTPERHREASKKEWDSQIWWPFHLSSATRIMRNRPIDYVCKISPRPILLCGVENDVVCPIDQGTIPMYEAAGAPKRFVRHSAPGMSHYESFAAGEGYIASEIINWFKDAHSVLHVSSVEEL